MFSPVALFPGPIRRWALLAGLSALAIAAWPASTYQAQGGDPCAPPNGNAIACENAQAGNPKTEWDVVGAGDESIQGFATDISVNRGQTVQFKVDTPATSYQLDIYRLGFYGGAGARKITTVNPSAPLPQVQPPCLQDFETGLVDCGNWGVSASWTVPATAVSGIYVAKAVRTDAGPAGRASHIVFIVRQDNSTSAIHFQADDTTWQAYNNYGGNSLYSGAPAGRAYKVSYNRPFNTRAELSGMGASNWVFWGLYPMIRYLEANGFDVTYSSGVDTDRRGSQLLGHKVFLSAGHDEYWSAAQRTNVEAARAAGVHLAFFSGNLHYWKTRYEPSIAAGATPYRTLVCYKETIAGQKIDPSSVWTGTWRDPRFTPPSDGGRPENALVGTYFTVNRGPDDMAGTSIQVPEEEGKMRLWRNTTVAGLTPGQVAVLSDNVLGYEWDEELDNGFRPGGLIRMSSTTENVPERLNSGYGAYEDFGPGTATHALTLYKHSSGALVFSAGTVQWSWGLDAVHDGAASVPDLRMRQATLNLLADMGIQPRTREADLFAATASTDVTPPTATITTPTNGLVVSRGQPVTVAGTASDAGGGMVAGVEFSNDGGATWHPAVGRGTWSYEWTPTATGNTTLRVRAVDDSANIQSPPATVNVQVIADTVAPQITARVPSPGATGVAAGDPVTVTFNESMNASTITSSTFELRTQFNQVVSSTVTYSSITRTATLQPTAVLNFSTTYNVRVRGGANGVKDFSGNALASDSTWSFQTWASPPCPCSLWNPATTAPTVADSGDTNAYELGVKFRADYDGYVTGLRFYKSALNTGVHTGRLWRASDGAELGSLTFTGESASGWQEAYFTTPVAVTAGTVYVGSYYTPSGHYAIDTGYFTQSGWNAAPLRSPGNLETPNGVYRPGSSGFPNQTHAASNYWVDVVYASTSGDTTAPTISQRTPAPDATGVQAGTAVTATFSEAMTVATITSSTFELRNAASQIVAATVTYNASTRTASLKPNTSLAFNATYSARVRGGSSGVKDLAGRALVSDSTWSFTTGAPPVCPCSLWDPATTTPETPDSGDTQVYELGIRFKPDLDGYVTGVRFYKSTANTGLHVANLWTAAGAPLASATFVNETGAGWQEVSFASPVAVSANTVYVASYHAPNGHYAFTAQYFGTTGVARYPLSAPVASDGGNGVYKEGASGFPNQTHNAANYWVDVVYLSAAGDTVAPTVTGTNPAGGATSVGAAANVTATFNEIMTAASITGATFELRNAANQLVPAAVSYNGSTRTAVVNPNAPFAFGASYTARLIAGSSGVKDLFGNPLASIVSWSFTVGASPNCPCSLWTTAAVPGTADSGDSSAYELGVKFRPSLDGYIYGARFYKSAANTGAHVAHLWDDAGQILATAPFTSETPSGWQEVAFSTPVQVNAGATYVVSYWAPMGHYAIDTNFFNSALTNGPLSALSNAESLNGLYLPGASGFPTQSHAAANYWVDALFVPAGVDTTAPTITARTPAIGATGVPVAAAIQVTFSENMTPSSISATNLQLRNAAAQNVAGAVAYNAATRVATFTPSATLGFSASYTVTVKGAAGGVRDVVGNTLTADAVWTFTTAAGANCPCSIWDPTTTTPAVIDSGDTLAYELGVKFRTEADGQITGVRFYKSASNTGTHVAHIWSSTGALLGEATFSGETASGWQTATFTTPVNVTAGTTYVASYWAPVGGYSFNGAYFTGGDVGAGPVKGLSNATSLNGVYRAGSIGFPTDSWNSNNYWVDVIFTPFGS